MSKNPFFSVISVTLNHLSGLRDTHDSLKIQDVRDFEWVVRDGGSTDGTVEYLSQSAARWISAPDRGIYDAMNRGIEDASGEYLLFLNAGDRLADAAVLQKTRAEIEKQNIPPDLVYGDSFEELSGTRNYKPARPHNTANLGMFTHHQSMLYRRTAIKDMRYDQNYKIAADYDFTCRLLQKTRHVLYCPFAISVFEGGGVSQQKPWMGRREQFNIRKKLHTANMLENCMIFSIQTALWNLRTLAPGLYWRLKSSGNKRSGSART